MNKLSTFLRESRTARFLIPMGICLIVFGFIVLAIDKNNKDYIKTEAEVTKTELVEEAYVDANDDVVQASYRIFVKYTVDGKEYETELGILPEIKVGEKVQIAYNPENPAQITQQINPIVTFIIIGGGAVALIAGVLSALKAIDKHKEMKEQEKGWSNGN